MGESTDPALAVPGPSVRRVASWGVGVSLGVAACLVASVAPSWWPVEVGPATALATFLAALACEYIDSSLGMGYGTTLTPLLLVAGYQPLQIVPAVLFSEALTGAAAGALHQRDGNVDFLTDRRARHTALLLVALSGAGATAAVLVAVSLPTDWLAVAISVVILAMGVVILATLRRPLPYSHTTLVAVGALAAFNKGLSGGGYGPLTTAGQVVSGLRAKHAVAITSVAESLTCAVGLAGYWSTGHELDWGLALPLTLGALLSVPMATATVRCMPESTIRTGVGAVTLLLGAVALAKVLSPG